MTTLTNHIRGQIIQGAIEAAFGAADEAYAVVSTEVADALYEHEHGKAEGIVRSLPTCWYALDDTVEFKAEGWCSRYSYNRHSNWTEHDEPVSYLKMSRQRAWPFNDGAISITDEHPLYEKVEALRRIYVRTFEAKMELRSSLVALLASCRTVEKLIETWPAAEQFLPKTTKPEKPTGIVPHDLAAKINKLMGIGS